MADDKKKIMTTDAGRPVGDNQNSLTVGPRGPVVFEDFLLFEKMAHFNRERIPERVVHAKGSGAHGYFACTNPDLPKYTTAKLFNSVGKKTPTFIRFSTVGGEKGSADTERDPRGFALKFYTEEGNWDMTGNNTPVFFIRDPLKFGDFIHTQKRDPETNLKSPTMMWDFWSLSPESLHQPHGRLQQPHLQPHQRQKRTLLREVAFQDQAGHQEFHSRIRRRNARPGS